MIGAIWLDEDAEYKSKSNQKNAYHIIKSVVSKIMGTYQEFWSLK